MLTRILFLFVCSVTFSFLSVSENDLMPGSPAYAGEGGGGGQDPTDAQQINNGNANNGSNDSAKGNSTKAKKVRGSLRSVDLNIEMLERSAKKNNLRAITTNLRRISSLRISIDTAYEELDGTEYKNEPQRIYDKLNEFSRQKKNKKLAAYAKALLKALAAERHLARALDAANKYHKAKKAGDVVEEVNQKVEYEDARADFHRKADQLPKKLRNHLFDKLPKEPPR